MNSLIEILNALSDRALGLAWPMLWQSSLLIALMFAAEPLLRRRVRASVRYALWLVVLAKLLLPPSLALPTGIGWWLRPAPVAPVAGSVPVVVSFRAQPERTLPETPALVPPPPVRPQLTAAAECLVVSGLVSLGLLGWMQLRWRRVARETREAEGAPAEIAALVARVGRMAGLGCLVRVRLMSRPMSPAVFGLTCPIVLLPRLLTEQLPPAQLQAVVLHELIHLKRHDVWVNCVQALLQLVYWWHPLLWLANARVRRLREEAVDDAVMQVLEGEADTYAPALVEVARLAWRRPLSTLGLVGIFESHSALHQRIKRLLDSRPPRKAGLTLGAALCVAAFGALALPMGEGPARPAATEARDSEPLFTRIFHVESGALLARLKEPPPLAQTNQNLIVREALQETFAGVDLAPPKSFFFSAGNGYLFVRASKLDLAIIEARLRALNAEPGVSEAPIPATQAAAANTLVQNGKLLYEMGKLNEAEAALKQALEQDPQNQAAYYYLNLIEESRAKARQGPSLNPLARTNRVTSSGRQAIYGKLDRIRLSRVSWDGLPLGDVIKTLSDQTRERDPEKRGVNFVLNQNRDTGAMPGQVDPATGLSVTKTAAAQSFDIVKLPIRIMPVLTDARVADVLEAIVKGAEKPIKYSIEDYAVVFSARSANEPPPLYTRLIKVDPTTFVNGLRSAAGLAPATEMKTPGLQKAIRDFFANLGVDLSAPKAIFFNDREGALMVRGTLQDLDIVESAVQTLNVAPPQITIETKFIDMPEGSVTRFWTGLGLPATSPTNAGRMLTPAQFRAALQAATNTPNSGIAHEASVTTLSGRQVQIQVVDLMTVVSNINPQALNPPGITTTSSNSPGLYVTGPVGLGPTLDLVPQVTRNGWAIQLATTPTLVQFLGYDQPTNSITVYVNGKKQKATPPLPRFSVHSVTNTTTIWDGYTLVLDDLVSETIARIKDKVPVLGDIPIAGRLFRSESSSVQKKRLLVFITPTLIDPAGNRVHRDGDVPGPTTK